MRQKKFISWYFNDGTREMCAIWKRLMIHIPRLFSIGLLFRTFFAPWHKDISPKSWRGFNPLLSARLFLWNFLSRFVGAGARTVVIFLGILCMFASIVCGGLLCVIYVLAPFGIVFSIVFIIVSGHFLWIFACVTSVLVFCYGFFVYRITGHLSYRTMTVAELNRFAWFSRVFHSIGVDPHTITPELLNDLSAFEVFLREHDITKDEFEFVIDWEIMRRMEYEQGVHFFSEYSLARLRPIGLRWHFGYTVHLDQYVDDLTEGDRSGYTQFLFRGFDQEMTLLEVVLARPHENNVIITGEVGSGRHMIVHELARRIRMGYYDHTFLEGMRIVSCDLMSVVAQARTAGEEPEYVVRNLFHEAAHAGNVIFVVDNFEQYMNAVAQIGFSFTALIDEYASLPSFRMIGIATERAFHEHIDHDRVLMRHFDVVPVHEMNENDAMHVLFMRFRDIENSTFTYQGFRQVIVDATRYMGDSPLPTRAINLAMEVLIYWQRIDGSRYITAQEVDEFVTQKTGMPIGDMAQSEKETLLSLEDHFRQRIVGQDAAVRAVASAVRRMRSGVVRPHRPAGSFLFLGPTGVGKTEMAKVLAEQYFGNSDRMIRVDMSEYQGPTAIDRLIGSKELGQQGIFVSQVREHPYALILLDEIERSNERVQDLFLQVLDEGFLHDAFGRKVTFDTTIIIATSNAGAPIIKKMIDMKMDPGDIEKKVLDAVMESRAFRPEFLNRFDDVVIFMPLTAQDVHRVANMILDVFAQRVAQEHDIVLQFDEMIADTVIERGFDPVFGARSLHHYVDAVIGDALAKKIIVGNVKRGEKVFFNVSDL